jgi:hypothetical protein
MTENVTSEMTCPACGAAARPRGGGYDCGCSLRSRMNAVRGVGIHRLADGGTLTVAAPPDGDGSPPWSDEP